MRLILVHLNPGPVSTTLHEHAGVVVPGAAEKTVFEVPVTALERFLGLLAEATEGLEQLCPDCGENLAAWPSPSARGR